MSLSPNNNSWILNQAGIPGPTTKTFTLSTQQAINRTIDGSQAVDYIGAEKFIITCKWDFITKTDFDFIKAQYDDQRLNGNAKNLTIAALGINSNVIINLVSYDLPLPNHFNYRSLVLNFYQV